MISVRDMENFTKIPNDLLERLGAADLNGTELKVALCILRFTFGFQRDSCPLSATFISRWANCGVRNTKKAIRRLREVGLIEVLNPDQRGSTLEITFCQSQGITSAQLDTGAQLDTSAQSDTGVVPNQAQGVVPNQAHNKINILKKTKEKSCASDAAHSEADESCVDKPTELEQDKDDFARIYGIYPKKRGRAKAFQYYRGFVGPGRVIDGTRYRLTPRQIYLAVDSYVEERRGEGTELKFYQDLSTFFNRTIIDYLDQGEE